MQKVVVSHIKELRSKLKRKRNEITGYLDVLFYDQCREVLRAAMRMDVNRTFLDDPSHLEHYTEYVRRPIYWKLIEKKLSSYLYSSPEDFIADMRLLFDNCYTFNTRQSSVSNAAKKIEIEVESLFVTRLNQPPPSVTDIKALGKNISSDTAKELWQTICFYESKSEHTAAGEKVYITPNKYSCACQRRLLETLRQAKDPKSSSRDSQRRRIPKPSTMRKAVGTNVITPASSTVVAEDYKEKKKSQLGEDRINEPETLKLDAVPQNARSDYAVREVSPVNAVNGEEYLSDEEDVTFADL